MTNLFKKPAAPVAPPAAPDYAVAQEATRQKQLADEEQRRLKGRAATILTGGQGVTEAAPVSRVLLS